MPKIERKTQKIFGGNAESDQLAVFGSMITGTPVYNDDIETLQSEAYTEGWQVAVAANEAPFMEEMNGVQYGFSKQLAYLFQQGIAEWDAGTTYYLNSFCQVGGVIYKSMQDENINHSPADDTEGTYWSPLETGGGGSSGLEVGDIGMALYVDETKGLRRYLNGQIVEINSNTQAFLNRLLQIQTTNPEYFTTEDNWQAEALLNIDGCVYKFVLNYASDGETVVSVRLPKYPDYVEINAGGTLPVVGNGISLGFPNGIQTGVMSQYADGGAQSYGAFLYTGGSGSNVGTAPSGGSFDVNRAVGLTTDPTKSGIEATLNQTKLKLRYYIQIATGQETEVNITNEIELNNPFFFGMSQYFDVEPNNLSWLKSDGVYKPKSVYPDYYNWILENVNKGVEGFKGQEGYCFIATDSSSYYWWVSTESPVVGASVYRYDAGVNSMFFDGTVETLTSNGFTFTSIFEGSSYTVTRDSSKDTSILHPTAWITDYDFVINTSDETFRLPIKAINSNYKYSHFPDFNNKTSLTTNFIAPNNGWFCLKAGTQGAVTSINGVIVQDSFPAGANYSDRNIFIRVKKGDTATAIGKGGYFVPEIVVKETDSNDLFLYYYVGATVQNANLIDAGRMQEQITNINAPSRGYLVQSYVNGTSGYRVYSDGWCEQWGKSNSTSGQETITLTKAYNSINFTVLATSYSNNLYGTAQIINNKTIWIESRGHDFTVQPCVVRWLTMGYIS